MEKLRENQKGNLFFAYCSKIWLNAVSFILSIGYVYSTSIKQVAMGPMAWQLPRVEMFHTETISLHIYLETTLKEEAL